MHHFVPKSDLGKQLREQHMRHHFQDHRFGYGVSSPLWDVGLPHAAAQAQTASPLGRDRTTGVRYVHNGQLARAIPD